MAFVPWPDDKFIRFIEGKGHGLRQRLRLRDFDALDPEALIRTYENIMLLDLRSVPNEPAYAVLEADIRAWSALAYREDDGPWLVVTNPWHAATRRRVSLMEEVAHIILNHKPTKLTPDPLTGLPHRSFTLSKEKEAYGVAGAALVPYNGLVPLLENGKSDDEIAGIYQVSSELVRMRLKVTRLHKRTVDAPGGARAKG